MKSLKKIIENLKEEEKAINEIVKAYRLAGFEVYQKINIIKEGKIFTDIDILAVYNNIILLIEIRGENDSVRLKKLSNTDIVKKFDEFFIQESIISYNAELYNNIYKSGFSKNKKIVDIYFDFKRDGIKKEEKQFIIGLDQQIYLCVISSIALRYTRNEILDLFKVLPSEVMEKEGDDITERSLVNVKGHMIENDSEKMVVVCGIKVDKLLKRSKIYRYQGWNSEEGFQRMLIESKIRKMREYLLRTKASYPNNIIAIVGDGVDIDEKKPGEEVSIELPDDFGALLLVDGQHRLVSFSQDNYFEMGLEDTSSNDKIIKNLSRDKLLILTIVKFKEKNPKKPARLFVDINTKQTPLSGEDAIDILEFIDSKDTEQIEREVSANMLIKKINKKSKSILKNKFKIKFYETGKIPRKSLISYGGLSSLFIENSNMKGLFPNQRYQRASFINFCQKVIDIYFIALFKAMEDIFPGEVSEMIKDTSRKKYMFMSTTNLAALFRLLERHFLYDDETKDLFLNEDNIEEIKEYLIPIFENLSFEKKNWKKKRFKSSQWADLEKEFVKIIKKNYKEDFGNPSP